MTAQVVWLYVEQANGRPVYHHLGICTRQVPEKMVPTFREDAERVGCRLCYYCERGLGATPAAR